LVVLVDELVLVVMVRALAPVARADPLFRRPPRDDVRPDAAADRLLTEHLAHLGPVENLDLGLDPDFPVVDAEGLGELGPFGLARFSEGDDLELQRLPGTIAGLLQELLRPGRVEPVHLVEAGGPLGIVPLRLVRPARDVRRRALTGEDLLVDLLTV